MKKIQYRVGNLFDHPGRFLLQGCNAQGVMGSGVAKTARELYPQNYEIYRAAYEANGLRVGDVVVADCGRHVIFDAITQEFYGNDGKRYVSYDGMVDVMNKCNLLLKDESEYGYVIPELAMPRVGAGLAGGDWLIIAQIIESTATHFQPVVYVENADLIPR